MLSDAHTDQIIPLDKIIKNKNSTKYFGGKFSPDSKHFFFYLNGSLIWDGKLSRPVHSLSEILFNPKGNKGIYIGEWRGKKVVMLNGEQVSGEYDDISCDPTRLFNSSEDWICLVKKGDHFLILKNGKEEGVALGENPTVPFFSPLDVVVNQSAQNQLRQCLNLSRLMQNPPRLVL